MEQGYKRGTVQLQSPTTPSLSLAISHLAFFLPPNQKMSSDSEMAISEVSTAESAFRGAAEAPRGAGARAAGEEHVAGRAALCEQLACLGAATGLDAQAGARAIRTAHLWTILREQLAGTPAVVLAVMKLEHLDTVSSPSPSFSCRAQPMSSKQLLCFRSRLWRCEILRAGSGTS